MSPRPTTAPGGSSGNNFLPSWLGKGLSAVVTLVVIGFIAMLVLPAIFGLFSHQTPTTQAVRNEQGSVVAVAPLAPSAIPAPPEPPSPSIGNGALKTFDVGTDGSPLYAYVADTGSVLCQFRAPNVQFYWTGPDGAENLWHSGDDASVTMTYLRWQATEGTGKVTVRVLPPGSTCP